MKQRILLKGRPGLELLHRISSADILGLSIQKETEALILNPQGKILSYFKVKRMNEDSLEIQFSDDFLAHLEHYTFAERYQIESEPVDEPILGSESERIRALIPKEGQEFRSDGTVNPLEINLKHAIADQKGCYPGQEVIEKIISLGSPARRLCYLRKVEGESQPKLPANIFSQDGAEAGVLTSAHQGEGLAIMKRTHCKSGARVLIESEEWVLEKVSE